MKHPAPASVMVIEKHPLMREALCTAISAEVDLKVSGQVENGLALLKLTKNPNLCALELKIQPDIILISLGNPGTNELEAISELKNYLPETAILALTNDEVPEQEQTALAAGAHLTLSKAEPRPVLINILRSLRTFKLNTQKEDFEHYLDQYMTGVQVSSSHR